MEYKIQLAQRVDAGSIATAQSQPYHLISRGRVLVYAPKALPGFEIADRWNYRPTESEIGWLVDCVQRRIAKEQRNTRKRNRNDRSFMQAFERELEKEQRKLRGEEGAYGQGSPEL